MKSHTLTTFKDIKTEVTNVKQSQSAVVAKTGSAMDVDVVQRCLQRCRDGQGLGGRVLVLREEGPSSFRVPRIRADGAPDSTRRSAECWLPFCMKI